MFQDRSRWIAGLTGALALGATGLSHGALTLGSLELNYDEDNKTTANWLASTPGVNTTKDFIFDTPSAISINTAPSDFMPNWYTFDGTTDSVGRTGAFTGIQSDLGGTGTAGAASFEFWIRPASLSGGQQLIFETGGAVTGASLSLWDDTLHFATKAQAVGSNNNEPEVDLTHVLTPSDLDDFVQVVGVIDGPSSTTTLYVNGAAVGTINVSSTFAGQNAAALGGIVSEIGASSLDSNDAFFNGNFVNYTGDIGIARFYSDALTAPEVADNYAAVIPEPGALGLGAVGLGLMAVRRR